MLAETSQAQKTHGGYTANLITARREICISQEQGKVKVCHSHIPPLSVGMGSWALIVLNAWASTSFSIWQPGRIRFRKMETVHISLDCYDIHVTVFLKEKKAYFTFLNFYL
jgi:hypothetical protein